MNLGSVLKGSYWRVLSRGLSLSELCFEMDRKGHRERLGGSFRD